MRRPRSRKQRSLALEALQPQLGAPATLRRHPVGGNRHWPRKWAYALDGLKGEDLDAEVEHAPAELRGMIRYYVLVYFPMDRERAAIRQRAAVNRRFGELKHNTRDER